MKLYERIKYLRKNILKLNQEEFSKNIGISRSNVTNIEVGRINVTDRVISDICVAYNVNEDWLINGSGEIFNPSSDDIIDELSKEYHFTSFENNFLRSYLNLDIKKREAVSEFLINIIQTSNLTIESKGINFDGNYIDKELAAYKIELEAEKKGKTLSVLDEKKETS